jgi:glc operon protein GlcG
MITKHTLTASDARRMVAACRAEAERNGWAVTIAVLDDAAQLLHLERLGARALTVEVALAKAKTAVLTQAPSATWEQRVKDTPNLAALQLMPLRGALPLMYEGQCVGAIGVSGVKAEEDEQVAQAGVVALLAKS